MSHQVFVLGAKWCQWLWLSLWGGCQPLGWHGTQLGMLPWGLAFGLCCRESGLSSSAIQLYACTVTSPVRGANVWYNFILLHCNFPVVSISWLFCPSSASNGAEHIRACAASGSGPMIQACCGSASGWVAVPSRSIHVFLPCPCKCLVTVGGHLAHGGTVSLVQTSSTRGRSTFCRSN